MRKLFATLAIVVATLLEVSAVAAATEPPPKGFELEEGAPSIDALITRFLEALEHKDAVALNRLRVTEREYRDFILPGSAREGQPPQRATESESEFLWGLVDTKSRYVIQALLAEHGGRRYALKGVNYNKGLKPYLWYQAYRDPEILIETNDGTRLTMPIGAIAEVNGKYKFVGLHKD